MRFRMKNTKNNIRLSSLKINLETTQQVFEKQKSLFDKGGVTLSEVKNAEVGFINAKYAYDDALIRLKKMKVICPFTGTITDLPYYTPDLKITAGSAMLTVMDYGKLYMDISLAEKNMGIVKKAVRKYLLPIILFQTIPSQVL